MSQLIILRGNSGSGKSTTALALQARLGKNTLLISQDVIRREIMYTSDGPDTLIIPMIIEMVRYGRTVCPYIIVEGIFKAPWYADMFETIIKLCNQPPLIYYFDLPFQETLKRHQQRDKANDFGEEAMRSWWNEHDQLGHANEFLFNESHTPKEILAIIETALNNSASTQKKRTDQ
ncbi:AAA family ATPase [Marinilactibacillus kalidii]|uniref:AAA family ATPase n=1 Tax=Marinilactibacillus kalidii TaxID=2820274 RepID=UPI001ABE2E95|nr:AAA family ATPase [Marinilactibacillus kalidii]